MIEIAHDMIRWFFFQRRSKPNVWSHELRIKLYEVVSGELCAIIYQKRRIEGRTPTEKICYDRGLW